MSSSTTLIKKGIAGAVLRANVAAAAAITSGVAMTTVSTPVTRLFGLVQIGVTTTTVVATPVAIAFAIGGGVTAFSTPVRFVGANLFAQCE